MFEPQSLALLVQRFREQHVGAISGNTKIGNREGLLGRWQHIEYVMGFNLDRRAYEVVGSTPTVPGAIGAFRRQALQDIGGVSGATLAEDTDITLDIGRAGWHVVYEQRARAWTEAPRTVRALYRQRSRWAYGTIQSMWKHRGGAVDGNRGARAVTVLALFQIVLPLAAPLIDLFALYSIIFQDPMPILEFWLAFNVFQFTLAWVAFGYDRESRGVLWSLPLQQLVYRQIMYLVVYDAIVSAFLGGRLAVAEHRAHGPGGRRLGLATVSRGAMALGGRQRGDRGRRDGLCERRLQRRERCQRRLVGQGGRERRRPAAGGVRRRRAGAEHAGADARAAAGVGAVIFRVNQVGYIAGCPKLAFVMTPRASGSPAFSVLGAGGRVILRGTASAPARWNARYVVRATGLQRRARAGRVRPALRRPALRARARGRRSGPLPAAGGRRAGVPAVTARRCRRHRRGDGASAVAPG